MKLTHQRLLELLDYSPSTGLFFWKVTRGGSAKRGTIAGSYDTKGYLQIKIDGHLYLAHRLAWLFVMGRWPVSHIDHIDGRPANNRIENLRLCTHAENHQNVGIRADNTSGVKGVSWNRKAGKWLAYINVQGRRNRLGLFAEKDAAISARLDAERQFHPFAQRKA
jgi:hypothetical protein